MSKHIAACLTLSLALTAADQTHAQQGAPDGEWPTYGGDLGHTRYSALDQIDAENFNELELAWQFSTENLGPGPEYIFQSTPLMVDDVLYSTGGTRRAVVALDAGTGELLWLHRLNEGERGASAPRRLSGRGLTHWDDGGDGVVFYVTPGYQLIGLNAQTGRRLAGFGENGLIDLKQNMDQDLGPLAEVGLHAAPIIADGVIVIGAAHLAGVAPTTKEKPKGHIRGYDARTGERKWIFHTIPDADEFGNESSLSSPVTRTTESASDVSAPTNLQVVAAGNASMVTISWAAPSQFTSFRVQRKQVGSDSSSGSFTTVALSVTGTSFEDVSVSSGVVYTYRVLTRLDNDFSEPSEEKTVVVP